MPAFGIQEIKQLYRNEPQNACNRICEALETKVLRPDDLSIRDVFLGSVEDGEEALRLIDPRRKSGGFRLQESGLSAVKTSDFSAITGQLVFTKVKEGYEYPELFTDQLCSPWHTDFLEGERVPGVGGIGDKIEVVGEGENFPYLGLNEEYIDFGPVEKRGFIVPITREMIIADRTGLVLKRAGDGGKFMAINKHKRVMDVVTGQVNSYKRNGTATNTYLSSGAYINTTASTLTDWRSIEAGELLFDAITDPNTGEPIILDQGSLVLLVPSALKRTAQRIIGATQIRYGDGASNSTAAYTPTPGGLPGQGAAGINGNYRVLSNAYVKARTSSASTYFMGDFKGAFVYREAWGMDMLQLGEGSEANFNQDIAMRYRVTECGLAGVMEPRKSVKLT